MTSIFSKLAFILGLVVCIPAILILLATSFNVSETNPLAIITFAAAAISSVPELPLQNIVYWLGIPVVLPAISIILGIIGIKKDELKKKYAFIGIGLISISLVMHLLMGTYA